MFMEKVPLSLSLELSLVWSSNAEHLQQMDGDVIVDTKNAIYQSINS